MPPEPADPLKRVLASVRDPLNRAWLARLLETGDQLAARALGQEHRGQRGHAPAPDQADGHPQGPGDGRET
jgi:hypothetical protein